MLHRLSFSSRKADDEGPPPGDRSFDPLPGAAEAPRFEASDAQQFYDLADALEANESNRFADPHDIIGTPLFEEGVEILTDADVSVEQVVSYCLATHWVLGILASEALVRREDSVDVVDRVLANIGQAAQWPLFFRLRFLAARAEDPVIGPVLTRVQESWAGAPVTVAAIDEFIEQRVATGEELAFGSALDGLRSRASSDG